MWIGVKDGQYFMRHVCQSDQLTTYGWMRHNGHDYGHQVLVDHGLRLEKSFLKSRSEGSGYGGDWTVRFDVQTGVLTRSSSAIRAFPFPLPSWEQDAGALLTSMACCVAPCLSGSRRPRLASQLMRQGQFELGVGVPHQGSAITVSVVAAPTVEGRDRLGWVHGGGGVCVRDIVSATMLLSPFSLRVKKSRLIIVNKSKILILPTRRVCYYLSALTFCPVYRWLVVYQTRRTNHLRAHIPADLTWYLYGRNGVARHYTQAKLQGELFSALLSLPFPLQQVPRAPHKGASSCENQGRTGALEWKPLLAAAAAPSNASAPASCTVEHGLATDEDIKKMRSNKKKEESTPDTLAAKESYASLLAMLGWSR
ncbi:hypothetical protein Tsubulata_038946 [Turnera subulata]|uniref:Mannosyl-oligosaccharide glucosidase n=1 Tax=Turnera subulata TaxID=218843 RepID=A0A9Q0FTE1_9ROSI|nr:hypothetical protein Tsubulata_038946 [Turnera subulata]